MISVIEWILWAIVCVNALLFLIPSRPRNRAMDSWKVTRQKEFDHYWRQLPNNMQTDETAKELAAVVNHATGVSGNSSGGTEPLFLLEVLIWLAGVILTATLSISKFHLLWIYPLGLITPNVVYKLRMKKGLMAMRLHEK